MVSEGLYRRAFAVVCILAVFITTAAAQGVTKPKQGQGGSAVQGSVHEQLPWNADGSRVEVAPRAVVANLALCRKQRIKLHLADSEGVGVAAAHSTLNVPPGVSVRKAFERGAHPLLAGGD
jgi:hypothetical protein